MKCYLGPYIWDSGLYVLPTGATSSIDLRNHTKMSTPNLSDGIGLFTGNITDSNYAKLGDVFDIVGEATKDTWKSLVGYRPKGNTIADLIFDYLTMGTDPRGLDQARPLMPETGRRLNVYLENQLIKTKRFDFGISPETNQVQSTLQEDYRTVYNEHYDMRKKYLGTHQLKFRLSNPEDFLIPNDLPKEKAEKPTSTLLENFNGINQAQVGHQLTWTEPDTGGFWDNFNNHARRIGIAANEDRRMIYVSTALSGVDQQSVTNIVVQDNNEQTQAGPACRRNGLTVTFYWCRIIRNVGGANTIDLAKSIANVGSIISSSPSVTITLPYEAKLQVIGSALRSFVDNVVQNVLTDTSIPGGLNCGLWGRRNTNAEVEFDDFLASDIIRFADDPVAGAGTYLLMGF